MFRFRFDDHIWLRYMIYDHIWWRHQCHSTVYNCCNASWAKKNTKNKNNKPLYTHIWQSVPTSQSVFVSSMIHGFFFLKLWHCHFIITKHFLLNWASLTFLSSQEQSASSRLPGARPQPGSSQDCTQTETLLITSKTISKTPQKSRTRDKHKNKNNDTKLKDKFHDAWIHPTARLNSKTAWKSTPN